MVEESGDAKSFGGWRYNTLTDEFCITDGTKVILGVGLTRTIQNLDALSEHILPDELANVRSFLEQLVVAGVPHSLDFRIQRADKKQAGVRIMGDVERDAVGKVIALQGLLCELPVRERRKLNYVASLYQLEDSTRLLQLILDTIPVRVFWKDLNSVFQGCNTRFANDAGLDHPDDLIGKDDFAMAWSDQAELYRADDQEVISSGVPKENYEEEQTTPLGNTIWLRTSKIPLCDANGKVIGVLGTYEDITEYKKMMEKSGHRERLEAIGRLAGGVAHDFNNLLTVILGNIEMAGLHPDRKELMQGALTQIEAAAKRAANLTGQLLAFARKQIISPQIIDINEQIEKIHALLSPLLGEDVHVAVELADMPLPILIDPGQFEQLLINLVVNARDAMPMGGMLTIESNYVVIDESYCETHDDVMPGEYVQLVISDTGNGMDEEMQRRVFEPFFTTKDSIGGTGLGLATCHGIVRQNGGHIWLHSEINRGSSFKIYLPMSRDLNETESVDQLVKPTASIGSETILVVEDEGRVNDLCVNTLNSAGYKVLSALSGFEALELADSYQGDIDILFSDVVLPDIRGTEVGKILMKKYPGICVLYTSGYTENAIVNDSVLEDDVNFLQKPYTPAQLCRLIRQLLDQKKLSK